MNARRLAASCAMAACALGIPPTARTQSGVPSRDLARTLASRIIAAVAPLDRVRLAAADPASPRAAEEGAVVREVAAALQAGGLTLVSDPAAAARVRVKCSENLRERVCAAEIMKGESREIVSASLPRLPAAPPAGAAAVSPALVTLDVQPVLARRDAILDLVEVGDRLLVLHTDGFDLYQHGDAGWKAAGTVAFARRPAWPRDPRARLSVRGDGIDAFLPGITCRCTLDPLKAECTASDAAPWPVGPPNSTLVLGRNYFTSPNVPPFFSAAPLAAGPGSSWLVAGVDGHPHLLGTGTDANQPLPDLGDEIASVQTGCGTGRQIVATASDAGGQADSLRAYEVAGSRLTPLTAAVLMPGRMTALWETPGGRSVLAVARNSDRDRYEAFYVGLNCAAR